MLETLTKIKTRLLLLIVFADWTTSYVSNISQLTVEWLLLWKVLCNNLTHREHLDLQMP